MRVFSLLQRMGEKEHLIRACVHDKVDDLFLERQEEPHPASAATSQQSFSKTSSGARIKLCRCYILLQQVLLIRETGQLQLLMVYVADGGMQLAYSL